MEELAPAVFRLDGHPRDALNVYVVGDVLIDAGTSFARKRILRQLGGRTITAHAITHAHPDHYGASHAICAALDLPLWCPEGDVETVVTGRSPFAGPATSAMAKLMARMPLPHPHPVARVLREGDEVGGFTVLETPGHSPGHVSYWRESDRTLIVGDVLFGQTLLGRPGLTEPPAFIGDRAQNRRAIHRLAALEPALALFGHGPPLRDPGRLQAFADGLGEVREDEPDATPRMRAEETVRRFRRGMKDAREKLPR
jgi:glyoxylase-like metal-dependent hydrolase (beta-lactamase superfamily II)